MNINKLLDAKSVKVSYIDTKHSPLDIESFMIRNKLSKVAFANIMGVRVSTVNNWISGKTEIKGTAAILFSLLKQDPALISKIMVVAD